MATVIRDEFNDVGGTLLSDHTPDEGGLTWSAPTSWEIASGGTHVEQTGTGSHSLATVDVGQDVRLETVMLARRGSASGRWNGVAVLGDGTANGSIYVRFVGGGAAPDIEVSDATANVRATFDIGTLSSQAQSTDVVGLAVEFDTSTDVLTIELDLDPLGPSSAWESVGTYDLDADGRSTDHGSGNPAATRWGLYDNSRQGNSDHYSLTITTLGGSGPQSVSLPALAASSALHTPTATPQAVTLALPALSSTSSQHTPTVAPQPVTVELPVVASSSTLHAPTTGLQTKFVALPHVVAGNQLYAPGVAPQPVDVALPHTPADSEAVHAPTLSLAPYAVVLDHVPASSQLHAPTATVQGVSVAIPHLAQGSTLWPPSLTGLSGVELPFVASVGSSLHTMQVGDVGPDEGDGILLEGTDFLLLESGSFVLLEDGTSGTSVTLPLIARTSQVHVFESLQLGDVELPLLVNTNALTAPQVSTPLVMPSISSSTSLTTPTVSVTVELPVISETTTTHVPDVAHVVALPHVEDGDSLYTFSVYSGGVALTTPTLTSGTALHSMEIGVGAATLELPLLDSSSVLRRPVVSAAGTGVTLPELVNTSGMHAPALSAGAVEVQLPVLSDVPDVLHPFGNLDRFVTLPHTDGGGEVLHAPNVAAPVTLPFMPATGSALHALEVSPAPVTALLPVITPSATVVHPFDNLFVTVITIPYVASSTVLHAPIRRIDFEDDDIIIRQGSGVCSDDETVTVSQSRDGYVVQQPEEHVEVQMR